MNWLFDGPGTIIAGIVIGAVIGGVFGPRIAEKLKNKP